MKWLLTGLLLITGLAWANPNDPDIANVQFDQVAYWFDGATHLGAEEATPNYRLVYAQDIVQGAIFYTHRVTAIPAYSGKPIATLVGIDNQSIIRGVKIVQHDEPILVIGVKNQDLKALTDQYTGLNVWDKIRINASDRSGFIGVDGISGATITTMVLNRSIIASARKVAEELQWLPIKNTISSDSTTEPHVGPWSERLAQWQDQMPTVIVLTLALGFLLFILFFQDWLVRKQRLFRTIRIAFLLFTVFVVGYVFSAQLSIVNVLAFIQTLNHEFTWDTLVIDAGIFLLWGFVAVFILLWGRGVYCGWLCPFGAMQELIHMAARKLKVPQLEIPSMVHERLWAIKYIVLIVLIGISLDSFSTAAAMAEVEPFKTVFTLGFDREQGYLWYAGILLAISAFNSKFFCKYLCALGASLSILGRFKTFNWLRRRNECGKPCQACASRCSIGAIKPTGEIIDNECHYCLECQVMYWDDHVCPPLVEKRKRQERRQKVHLKKPTV